MVQHIWSLLTAYAIVIAVVLAGAIAIGLLLIGQQGRISLRHYLRSRAKRMLAGARSTTIPPPQTAAKRRQPTAETVLWFIALGLYCLLLRFVVVLPFIRFGIERILLLVFVACVYSSIRGHERAVRGLKAARFVVLALLYLYLAGVFFAWVFLAYVMRGFGPP